MLVYIFHYAWKWTHFSEKFCHIFSLYVSFYLFIDELSLWPGTNNLLCRHFEFTKKAQSKWYATQYLKFWWNLNTSFWYLLPDSLDQLVCMLKDRMRTRWPSNPTSGHIHQGNQIWKRHMHPNVHRSTVYHSQDMEAT